MRDQRSKKMLGYTNIDSEKGFYSSRSLMKEQGILKELEAQGIEDGDTVRMYGLNLIIINNKKLMLMALGNGAEMRNVMALTSKQRAWRMS